MTVKHATASTHLFARIGGGWRLGMIEHPRLGGVLVPVGHVEGVADHPHDPVAPAGHPLHWVTAEELPGLETPLDVRILGAELFRRIGLLAETADAAN